MDSFETLKQKIKNANNEELARIISDAALRLDKEQTDTVSFVFWLSFMTENDLDQVLCGAWKMAKEYGPSSEEVIKIIKEKYSIDIAKIDPDDPDYNPTTVYFGDKIKIYEDMFGTNSNVELFRKIKGLRNDISHGRIDGLKYEGLDLKTKEGKQKILIDYFGTTTKRDSVEPLIFQQMSEAEKGEVKKIFEKWKKDKGYEE
jgi:hypothetical protein